MFGTTSTYGVGIESATKVALYAIGGNALSDPNSPDEQLVAEIRTQVIEDVLDLLEAGYRVVLTHGNGPQVGDLLMLEEAHRIQHAGSSMRADIGLANWVAATQGMIGHELGLELDSMLDSRDRPERTALVLTRVRVDERDAAFAEPTKPIGPVLSDSFQPPENWSVSRTERGLRRVVASPEPIEVLDLDLVRQLVSLGAVVICGGGGGIPITTEGGWSGIAAVIDKDRLSALLAISLGADVFLISTPVERVELSFGTDSARPLSSMSLDEAEMWLSQGEFPPGSMGPKVEAMIAAKRHLPECQVSLCSPGSALAALRGETGTRMTSTSAEE